MPAAVGRPAAPLVPGALALVLVALLAPAPAAAQEGAGTPSGHGLPAAAREGPAPAAPASPLAAPLEERWRRRFPQPTLVSDLVGRRVIDRNQGVLGRVTAVVAAPGGELRIAFARRRLLVLDGPTVTVPLMTTAALGPFVMLLDVSDEEIARLPALDPAGARAVDPASRVGMALTKH